MLVTANIILFRGSNNQAAMATALASTAIAGMDVDEDGLSNNQELSLGTDPLNSDTDGDGLLDGAEVNQFGTMPTNPDTDGDTLGDGEEVNNLHTLPLNPDYIAWLILKDSFRSIT